jgi:hypothetical protein
MSEGLAKSDTRIGSERSFGLVFAAFFTIVAAWPLLGGSGPRPWALAVAAAFALVALFAPATLRPANLIWARFGILLGRIIAPLVMALVFFVAVTPTAWIMRALGKDVLRLRFDPAAKSYWIPRDPAAARTSMRNQF